MQRSAIVHLGWDEQWESLLAEHDVSGVPGRLARVERGESDVWTEQGEVRVRSDSTRSQSSLAPVTGDWVTVASDEDGAPVVEAILARRTVLVRRDPGERGEEQPLAANVDYVFLVHGFDRPFRVGKLERFLVLAWNADAAPVVVLTKSDLADPDDLSELIATVEAVAPGVLVLTTSIATGEGMAELNALLAGHRTGALLGESGAGKSSLVNALLGAQVQAIGEVRRSDSKGRHTTTTRDLIVLPDGGLLIDTPGIRAVGLWDARDALERVFSDIEDLAEHCRFRDCAHGAEPDCAVATAVEAGEVDVRRLDRYRAMSDELAELEARVVERDRKAKGGRKRR